jgi:hypothetical protein
MKRPTRFTAIAMLALGAVPALAATPEPSSKAGDLCEYAVSDTVRRLRGRQAEEVEFVAARRVVAPPDELDEIRVKGEGRYRGAASPATTFSYSCAYNARTRATSGVVLRETGPARAGAANVAWEPDLMKLAPEDCETAAASQLKEKYPRVGRITFGGDSRQLRPAPNDHTSLEGEGAVQRAPGMNAVPFRYRCEIETASGRVVGVQTSD